MKPLNAANMLVANLIAAIAISGCTVLAPQRDRAKYFVLAPTQNAGDLTQPAGATGGQSIPIGVGPITIPRYLERPEVVTRVSDTQLSVSETNRWAEPLETSVASVLRQDLSNQLASAQIITFPWSRKQQIDYRVKVDFHSLECTAAGNAIVEASWAIQQGTDGSMVHTGSTQFTAPSGKDGRAASAALSRGIAQVSSDIARQLITIFSTHQSASPPPSS
jgi:uncharacterized protein